MRYIKSKVPTLDELKMPAILKELIMHRRGLLLMVGGTNSGKSTSLAAMINHRNENQAGHILTIEDPIEYVHNHRRSIDDQREVGGDTDSFPNALKYVLRQDPDVILIGEMRDLETIALAITAAETGHLVFGTLHTTDAAQTINRLIDTFPPHQQDQARTQISFVLRAIVAQQLLQTASGKGRIVCEEILIINPAVQNIVREHKIQQLYTVMQTGQNLGMKTFEQSLRDLYQRGEITYQEAMTHTLRPDELARMLKS